MQDAASQPDAMASYCAPKTAGKNGFPCGVRSTHLSTVSLCMINEHGLLEHAGQSSSRKIAGKAGMNRRVERRSIFTVFGSIMKNADGQSVSKGLSFRHGMVG